MVSSDIANHLINDLLPLAWFRANGGRGTTL